MPPLRDEASCELAKYKTVLEQAGRFADFVKWKREAAETVREHLSNCTQRGIEMLLSEHREEVDQTRETRPDHRTRYAYHYDFRIVIRGQSVYIETVFEPGATDEHSSIRIVRVKPAKPGDPWGKKKS